MNKIMKSNFIHDGVLKSHSLGFRSPGPSHAYVDWPDADVHGQYVVHQLEYVFDVQTNVTITLNQPRNTHARLAFQGLISAFKAGAAAGPNVYDDSDSSQTIYTFRNVSTSTFLTEFWKYCKKLKHDEITYVIDRATAPTKLYWNWGPNVEIPEQEGRVKMCAMWFYNKLIAWGGLASCLYHEEAFEIEDCMMLKRRFGIDVNPRSPAVTLQEKEVLKIFPHFEFPDDCVPPQVWTRKDGEVVDLELEDRRVYLETMPEQEEEEGEFDSIPDQEGEFDNDSIIYYTFPLGWNVYIKHILYYLKNLSLHEFFGSAEASRWTLEDYLLSKWDTVNYVDLTALFRQLMNVVMALSDHPYFKTPTGKLNTVHCEDWDELLACCFHSTMVPSGCSKCTVFNCTTGSDLDVITVKDVEGDDIQVAIAYDTKGVFSLLQRRYVIGMENLLLERGNILVYPKSHKACYDKEELEVISKNVLDYIFSSEYEVENFDRLWEVVVHADAQEHFHWRIVANVPIEFYTKTNTSQYKVLSDVLIKDVRELKYRSEFIRYNDYQTIRHIVKCFKELINAQLHRRKLTDPQSMIPDISYLVGFFRRNYIHNANLCAAMAYMLYCVINQMFHKGFLKAIKGFNDYHFALAIVRDYMHNRKVISDTYFLLFYTCLLNNIGFLVFRSELDYIREDFICAHNDEDKIRLEFEFNKLEMKVSNSNGVIYQFQALIPLMGMDKPQYRSYHEAMFKTIKSRTTLFSDEFLVCYLFPRIGLAEDHPADPENKMRTNVEYQRMKEIVEADFVNPLVWAHFLYSEQPKMNELNFYPYGDKYNDALMSCLSPLPSQNDKFWVYQKTESNRTTVKRSGTTYNENTQRKVYHRGGTSRQVKSIYIRSDAPRNQNSFAALQDREDVKLAKKKRKLAKLKKEIEEYSNSTKANIQEMESDVYVPKHAKRSKHFREGGGDERSWDNLNRGQKKRRKYRALRKRKRANRKKSDD
jgi:hypothetical protein